MSSAPSTPRSLKIRRRGRHAAPTTVEKLAGKATSAAPAVVIAGSAIIAAPTAAGAATAGTAASSAQATADAAAHAAHMAHTAHVTHITHMERLAEAHAAHIAHVAHLARSASGATEGASSAGHASAGGAVLSVHVGGGTLGCSGLESLWKEAGGSPSEAHMAAEIAMAESGGNQYAVSPTDDYGYWQINGVHGSQATFDPVGNAKAAISISSDGADWSAWTTYTSGAYQGKC